METLAIETRSLTKAYPAVMALDGLNLEVKSGHIFGLIGPDGAGKTTTMRILAGILKPTGGTALVFGDDVVKSKNLIGEKIGYMSQHFGLYEDLTVRENIDFYADLYLVSRTEKEGRLRRLMEFSRLEPFLDRLAGKLSGGMKQKLGLACALIHTPKLLLLDEPTNGVDPVSRREFWKILYELLKERVTIFISTPYMDEADRCHMVGIMDNGRLLISGTPDDIRTKIKSIIFEIRAENGADARDALRTMEGIHSVVFFGDRIHAAAMSPSIDEKKIETFLKKSNITPTSLRKIVPTLEDAFFELSEAR